jgi:pimeloyl-ACP methyl ester carboxylesterase
MLTRTVPTALAGVCVLDSGGDGPAVLMIHGNSFCKEVFRRQFESPLSERFRLIAMDLPGHGASADAADPAVAYKLNGYADTAVEVLSALGVTRATLVGWSLGGHVALNMISLFPGMHGVMISGTPPVPAGIEGFGLGFKPTELMGLTGARDWSAADAETFARAAATPFEPFMLEAALRADGAAREAMLADALAGGAEDQRRIAETSAVPLAIVNGAEDSFINGDYFATVAYANLWAGRVHSLAGVGHAPFWEAPARFNPLLERFVAETAG